jgi:hypothetical protein
MDHSLYGSIFGLDFSRLLKDAIDQVLTFDTCQRPPRAVGILRTLSAAAIPRRSLIPVARMESSSKSAGVRGEMMVELKCRNPS